jgi:hypothetical protein
MPLVAFCPDTNAMSTKAVAEPRASVSLGLDWLLLLIVAAVAAICVSAPAVSVMHESEKFAP